MSACENEDCDPRVVSLILENLRDQEKDLVNYRRKSRTVKWKFVRWLAKASVRYTSNTSSLLRVLACGSGAAALHYAAHRGDVEIVELLISEGADPSLKNDLGLDAAAMYKSFPELRGVLEKRERVMKLRNTEKKTGAVEVLGKRISTATPIQHEMWLISLEHLLMLYGDGSRGHVIKVHQELRRQKLLTPWHSVPADVEIIFVSHEWLSWAHERW